MHADEFKKGVIKCVQIYYKKKDWGKRQVVRQPALDYCVIFFLIDGERTLLRVMSAAIKI